MTRKRNSLFFKLFLLVALLLLASLAVNVVIAQDDDGSMGDAEAEGQEGGQEISQDAGDQGGQEGGQEGGQDAGAEQGGQEGGQEGGQQGGQQEGGQRGGQEGGQRGGQEGGQEGGQQSGKAPEPKPVQKSLDKLINELTETEFLRRELNDTRSKMFELLRFPDELSKANAELAVKLVNLHIGLANAQSSVIESQAQASLALKRLDWCQTELNKCNNRVGVIAFEQQQYNRDLGSSSFGAKSCQEDLKRVQGELEVAKKFETQLKECRQSCKGSGTGGSTSAREKVCQDMLSKRATDLNRCSNDLLTLKNKHKRVTESEKKLQEEMKKLKEGAVVNSKSCKEILDRMGFAGPSGFYKITVDGQRTNVWCEMDFMGGGWTLVRRTVAGWSNPDDNLKGVTNYGVYSFPTAASTFGMRFQPVPFTEFMFATGDKQRFVIVDKEAVYNDWNTSGSHSCDSKVMIKSSHTNNAPYSALWCKRSGFKEDPLISAESHNYLGKNANNNDDQHSMLYAEQPITNLWLYHVIHHKGANVYIR